MNRFQVAGKVKECLGSVITPEQSGLKMILTVISQSGENSSDFYKMVTKRYGKAHQDYREWFVTQQNMKLGTLNNTAVASDAWIMQAVCLDKKNKLDKVALEGCIKKLVEQAKYENGSIHLSSMLLKEVPALKKLLPAMATEAGVNVYLYAEGTGAPKA